MIVKQDWLGPYNPVCAEMTVNEYYSYGTLYKTALLPYVVLANRTPPLFTQNTGKRLASPGISFSIQQPLMQRRTAMRME